MMFELNQIIDTVRYPIFERDGNGFDELISGITTSLEDDGCVVLKDFIRDEFMDALAREVSDVAQFSYNTVDDVNVYNTETDAEYALNDPARIVMKRGNAFVARDRIGVHAIIAKLYVDRDFKKFVARCFGLDQVFELEDPYAGLCANVLRRGLAHPWHFDTNEFTVSMLTQAAQGGGIFEYCPNIRTPSNENKGRVLDVITDSEEAATLRLELKPGDLQLFKGRYSLHRVTEVSGDTDRHCAIFAYSEIPGVIGSVTRTKQLFGRVSPEHLAAEARNARPDALLD